MKNYFFLPTHEWFNKSQSTIGISDYAQKEMGDIVFVELPEVGDKLEIGEVFANIESVKAVSEIFSPVTGTVKEVNEDILDNPELINENAYSAWFIKVEDAQQSDNLLTLEEYNKTI